VILSDVYDACVYSWSVGRSDVEWYHSIGQPLHTILKFINRVVVTVWFEYVICEFNKRFMISVLDLRL
jgi:hypothetical protein